MRAAAILALGLAAACASAPRSFEAREVGSGDRVRVWRDSTPGSRPVAVGAVADVESSGLRLRDGISIGRRDITALQVSDGRFRSRVRTGSCVRLGVAGALAVVALEQDDADVLLGIPLAYLSSSAARPCLFPYDWWIPARLPDGSPYAVDGPVGYDPRPATLLGQACETTIGMLVPLAPLALGLRDDGSGVPLGLAIVAASTLTGALQERVCPRRRPERARLGGEP